MEVRQAYLDPEAAAGQVEVARKNQDVAGEALEMTRARMEAGVHAAGRHQRDLCAQSGEVEPFARAGTCGRPYAIAAAGGRTAKAAIGAVICRRRV